jgi:hypothetical protein
MTEAQPRTAASKIRADGYIELINFIGQQKASEAEVFQIPLLLKSVKRCT